MTSKPPSSPPTDADAEDPCGALAAASDTAGAATDSAVTAGATAAVTAEATTGASTGVGTTGAGDITGMLRLGVDGADNADDPLEPKPLENFPFPHGKERSEFFTRSHASLLSPITYIPKISETPIPKIRKKVLFSWHTVMVVYAIRRQIVKIRNTITIRSVQALISDKAAVPETVCILSEEKYKVMNFK